MDSGGLKPGWTRATFGEVARQVKDHVDPATADLRRYVAGEHMDTDDLRIRRWGTVGDGYLGPAFHMRFRRGHVLYGSRRTYLRKVALADFDGVTANTTFVIATRDPTVLLPELLPFIMQTESFHEHSIEKSKGSVNPYVNFSDIAAYEFALPPLDEQCRIASALRGGSGGSRNRNENTPSGHNREKGPDLLSLPGRRHQRIASRYSDRAPTHIVGCCIPRQSLRSPTREDDVRGRPNREPASPVHPERKRAMERTRSG